MSALQTGQGRDFHSGIFTVRDNPLATGQGRAFHDGSLGQVFRDGSLGQGAHVFQDGSLGLGVLGSQAGAFRDGSLGFVQPRAFQDGSLGGRRAVRGIGDESAVAVSVSPTAIFIGGLAFLGIGIYAVHRLTKR